MLLTKKEFDDIAAGRVTLVFRRWRKPTVRAGGTLRTWGVVLAIDAVDRVTPSGISPAEAKRAGHTSREELIAALSSFTAGDLYRIKLHLGGPDPRAALRRAALSADDLAAIQRKLQRYDASAPKPWTIRVLQLIASRPGVRAADLAAVLRMNKDAFKLNVRKLKELGLTESLEVGYRISPRGQDFLKRVD
jgi:hypothetical protein